VRLCAKYRPTMPAVNLLLSRLDKVYEISTCSAVATRNTLEVALVLDNSGSMTSIATGTGKTRMDLLKGAATQLVDLLGGAADGLTQVDKAVQFAVVPFNQLVNVGAGHSGDKWMDQNGLSPVQNESFDWSAIRDGGLGAKKRVEFRNGTWVRKGTDWGTDDAKAITRFDLFSKVLKLPWAGCVEGRPYPYNVNDDPPILNKPETFFVPMFAIAARRLLDWEIIKNYNWTNEYLYRADAYRYPIVQPGTMIDYFQAAYASNSTLTGPNLSCTIAPIRPLTDATTVAGRTALKTAINAMSATRGTNVPEGLAWGWRMLSHGEPFTEGRPDEELGNDKVVIVLTDGANLYQPGNRSAYGYADQPSPPRTGYPRPFLGTKLDPNDLTDANTTAAMNQHFAELCKNAKLPRSSADKRSNVIVMTVALDLDSRVAVEKDQIKLLEDCASSSRIDPRRKMFWNATGATLSATFKDIADELSNLRVVQ
jgi:hypothetical protein